MSRWRQSRSCSRGSLAPPSDRHSLLGFLIMLMEPPLPYCPQPWYFSVSLALAEQHRGTRGVWVHSSASAPCETYCSVRRSAFLAASLMGLFA